MDALSSATAFATSGSNCGVSGTVETLLCMFVGVVMLCIEVNRRAGIESSPSSSPVRAKYAQALARFLRLCAPEVAALAACLALAAALRLRGDTHNPMDAQAWAEITSQWPLLVTADSLLSMQAMLRMVVFLSASIRRFAASRRQAADDRPATLLTGEVSVFWLWAGLARAALAVQKTPYMLDGPLGGMLPAAFEMAVLPFLLVLSRGTLRRAPVSCAFMAAAIGYLGFRNHLRLAGEPVVDSLFIIAHTCEAFAALGYVVHTLIVDNGCGDDASAGFTHLLMPIQQALSTYYFLNVFGYTPELVGVGVPFLVLQVANLFQFGAYLAALGVYLAESCVGGHEGRGAGAGGAAAGLAAAM